MELKSMFDYDVIFFGIHDSNGKDVINDEAVELVSQYIDLGYGVVLGHDVVGAEYGNEVGLGRIADKFGIKLGTANCSQTIKCSNGTINDKWRHWSGEIFVKKVGLPTQYPYEINQSNYSIPITHTAENAAFGDVWMELSNRTEDIPKDQYEGNFTAAESYAWNLTGYSETRYGNPHYYLTTYNNTAMIQTGHNPFNITEEERKLIVNSICYVYQRTTNNFLYDNSLQYINEPNAPNITMTDENNYRNRTILITPNPNEIMYRVIRFENNNATYYSNNVSLEYSTISEYLYIIDNYESTNITSNTLNQTKNTTTGTISNITNEESYIHAVAIDKLGRMSLTTHYSIKEIPTQTFTQSNTYSESNTFTQSNTYTKSNAFTQSNSFTKSNSFTESQIFNSNITRSITFSLTFSASLSLVQKSILNTFVISKIGSSVIYIQTEFIFFDYTIYYLHSYISYYSNLYIYNDQSESNNSKTISKGSMIAIICVSVAIVLIVISLFIFLFRHNKSKLQMSSTNESSKNIKSEKSNAINNDIQQLALKEDDQWL
ncbi:bacterial Ig-like domain protein [Histomonas meleagridis]|uniref:bacterial Ig-like domain protein n=1 Tax=Histomonas meleagridis TaxID=135588 RepID=UPI00355A337B|nr:bacterial Ig-like domain protein [Histomonas meleagridis]KAH0801119.1 bacterial Ig-like domain protein [Histomonas meleagridis]